MTATAKAPNFPLRDTTGKIRQATLAELQQCPHFGIWRSEDSIRRALQSARSTTTISMLEGELPLPKTIIVVRDRDFEQVVYMSNDDVTATLIYYKG